MWRGEFEPVGPKNAPLAKVRPDASETPKAEPMKEPHKSAPLPRDAKVAMFDRFYEENKDKLLMSKSYPRNEEAIREWQQALSASDECSKQIGRLVALGLQHIGFKEFHEALIRSAYEAIDLCEREDRSIVLFLPSSVGKSNTWVSLLIWPVIRSRVVRVVGKQGMAADSTMATPSKLLIVYADDGVFSGRQAAWNLENAYIPHKLRRQADRVKLMLVLGAVSSEGVAEIGKLCFGLAVFPSAAIQLRTLEEVARNALGDQYDAFVECVESSKSAAMLNVRLRSTLAVFDHKLPDAFSSLSLIIALAPALSVDGSTVTVRSLLAGCTPADYGVTTNNVEPADLPSVGGVGTHDHPTCPAVFYKQINYTYDGRSVDHKRSLPFFFD